MPEVLVVLVVLEELVVFEGGIFKRVVSTNFFLKKIIESKKKIVGANKNLKILKIKSKILQYFRVLHSISTLVANKIWNQTVTKLKKTQHCDKTQKVKLWQNSIYAKSLKWSFSRNILKPQQPMICTLGSVCDNFISTLMGMKEV